MMKQVGLSVIAHVNVMTQVGLLNGTCVNLGAQVGLPHVDQVKIMWAVWCCPRKTMTRVGLLSIGLIIIAQVNTVT